MKPIMKSVILIMFLFIFCTSLFPINASAASPIYVRQNGSDTNCNGLFPYSEAQATGDDCAFRTITHGIEEVSSGGEVRVISGTFDELVNLNRNVKVLFSDTSTINGNLSIQYGEFEASAPLFYLTGNFLRSDPGIFSHNNGTLILNGASAQTIGGSLATSFKNITIDNPSNIYLSKDIAIIGALNLQNGKVILNDSRLTFGPQATAAGTFSSSMMIITNGSGKVCKKYPNNYAGPWPTSTFTFPIGDQTGAYDYSPATISFSSGSFGIEPSVCMRVVDARLPQNYFPIHITRHWLAETDNLSSFSADVGFQYVQDDVVGDETELVGLSQSGVSWKSGLPINPTANTFSIVGPNLEAFTAGGNVLPIMLDTLVSASGPSSVRLNWQTTSETGIQGFNIFRSETPVIPGVPINPVLIPANNSCSQSVPCMYEYIDNTPTFGVLYHYWIGVLGEAAYQEYFGPIMDGSFLHSYLPVIRR